MSFQKGHPDYRTSKGLKEMGRKLSENRKGKNNPRWGKEPWNKGFTKETNEAIKITGERHSVILKRLYQAGIEIGFKMNNKTKSQYQNGHEGMKGKENPSWIDGRSYEPYTKEFNNKKKDRIRKRDNYICQRCGGTQELELQEFGRRLDVHHLDYNKKNCNDRNLVALCRQCNLFVNQNREYWERYFKKKVARNYKF